MTAEYSKSKHAPETGEEPWTHLTHERSNYATGYGIKPSKLPYEDEVDMMHEDPDRYQEVNHWYSSLQKPSEENVEVLKKVNHQRIEQLGQIYQEKLAMEANSYSGYDESQLESHRKHQLPKKTNKEINKEKEDYKNRFKRYLHNKESRIPKERSASPKALEFDRYQCTSPNPKYISKPNVVQYKDNM